jgi:hypothetical protein
MRDFAQNRVAALKAWFAKFVAESEPLQDLQYLGEKLWQLK